MHGVARRKTKGYLTGLTGELLVATELARLGFQVCLPSGNSPDLDMLAYRGGEVLAVQVKSAGVGNAIQLGLKKFLTLETDPETGVQVMTAKQPPLDDKLYVAFVYLGKQAGQDRIYVGRAPKIADFLERQHLAYLGRNSGVRPGRNKESDHIAVAEKDVMDCAAFSTLTANPVFLWQRQQADPSPVLSEHSP